MYPMKTDSRIQTTHIAQQNSLPNGLPAASLQTATDKRPSRRFTGAGSPVTAGARPRSAPTPPQGPLRRAGIPGRSAQPASVSDSQPATATPRTSTMPRAASKPQPALTPDNGSPAAQTSSPDKGITRKGFQIVGHRPGKPTGMTGEARKCTDYLPLKIKRVKKETATSAAGGTPTTGALPAAGATSPSSPVRVPAPTYTLRSEKNAPSMEPLPWSEVVAHIRNPGNDSRVSSLVARLETLHQESPTFRSRLSQMTREGGVTISVASKDKMPHAFTHSGKRRIHLSEEIATDVPGSADRSLPALAVEISNLCRRDEFEAVNTHFRNRRIGVTQAAQLKETAEFGSVNDMVRYFSEARGSLEQMGFGNPSKWYARLGPQGDVHAAYPTVDDYLRVAIKSGHTKGYERQFSAIAAQMSRPVDSSAKGD